MVGSINGGMFGCVLLFLLQELRNIELEKSEIRAVFLFCILFR